MTNPKCKTCNGAGKYISVNIPAQTANSIDCPDCTKLKCATWSKCANCGTKYQSSTTSIYCMLCRKSNPDLETAHLSKAQQCEVKLKALLQEFGFFIEASNYCCGCTTIPINLVNKNDENDFLEIGDLTYNGKTEVSE